MVDSEVKRLAQVASALRSRNNSISKQVATKCNEGLRTIVSLRDDQEALLRIDDDINIANTIAQLREIFLTFDNNHNDRMEVGEFKEACEWLNISAPESKLQNTFRKIDTNHDGYISENEFIAHVLSSNKLIASELDLEKFKPDNQLEALLGEVNRMKRDYERLSMGADTGGDKGEVERLRKEIETLRSTNQEMSRLMEVKF